MESNVEAKNWLKKVLIWLGVILTGLMLVAYIVDPFLYYRITDKKYMLISRFVNKGIIKNHEYDTVIIGSSMIQNFNMQSFRDKLGYEPIKATIGGMIPEEIEMMNKIVGEEGKADRVIINLDMTQFNAREQENRFPEYLYDQTKLNDFKYLLGYETWMRFIPVDIVVSALYERDISLPEKFDMSTNIDYLEDWSKESSFGKDSTLSSYKSSRKVITEKDTDNMFFNMSSKFDELIENMEMRSDTEYTFLFPPYSALYWYHAEEEGYRDILIEFKKYIIKSLEGHENIRVVDMQDLDYINKLDHYADWMHYDTYVQELIIDAIVSGEFDATSKNIDEKIGSMYRHVRLFEEENRGYLEELRLE